MGELERRLARLEQEVQSIRALMASAGETVSGGSLPKEPHATRPSDASIRAVDPLAPMASPPAEHPPVEPVHAAVGHPITAEPVQFAKRAGISTFLDNPLQARSTNLVRGVASPFERDEQAFAARLERALGGRWYALIGAVIVVIGLGLFLKLAVDHEWLSLSPVFRCLATAIAGVTLLATGEWTLRKLSRPASAGFSAAGVGTLMASVWAAHRLYDLTGPTVAFMLMAVACATGVLVAARARLASVAVVSLIGAYMTPLLVGDASRTMAGFFAYLLMVLITGLALPAWKGRRFFAVRGVAWLGTLLIGGLPAAGLIRANIAVTPLLFAVLAWTLIHIELAVTSLRRFPGEQEVDAFLLNGVSPSASAVARFTLSWRRSRSIITSFVVTAWTTVLVTRAAGSLLQGHAWVAPATLAASILATFPLLSSPRRLLRGMPRRFADRLGAALVLEAGALIIVATALAFSGSAAVVAWLAMGLAAVIAGNRLKARPIDVYGLILLTIGTARLVFHEALFGAGRGTSAGVIGLSWNHWTLLAIGAAVAWTVAARLVRARASASYWNMVSNAATGIGISAAGVSTLLGAEPPAVMAVAGVTAAVVAFAGSRLRSIGLTAYAAAILVVAMVLSPIAGAWTYPVKSSPQFAGLVLSPWALTWVTLAGAWAVMRWTRPSPQLGVLVARIATGGVALSLLLSVVHFEASLASISMVWLGMSLAMLLTGRWTAWKQFAIAGQAAMMLALAAWLAAFSPMRGRWPADEAAVLLSLGLWTGVCHALGAGLVAWLSWQWREKLGPSQLATPAVAILAVSACTVLWLATSMEAGRIGEIVSNDRTVQRAAVSVWWGIFGLGLISVGLLVMPVQRAMAATRRAGLALVAVAVLKALIWDLAHVPAGARVVSFIGLGLLMMTVTVVYTKLAGRLDRPVDAPPPPHEGLDERLDRPRTPAA